MLILFYYSLQTLPTDSLLQTTLHQKIEQNLCSDCAFLFTSLWSKLDSTQYDTKEVTFLTCLADAGITADTILSRQALTHYKA